MSYTVDTSVFIINLASVSTIINGTVHPSYLNQNLTIRGNVDEYGSLLLNSPYKINLFDGPVIYLDVTAVYTTRIVKQGAYYFVFYANPAGDLILYVANRDQPTVIGKWVYNASSQILTFSFFKSCFSPVLGSLIVNLAINSSNVVSSVNGVESFSSNGSPTEVELSGVLNNTLSSISNGNIQMMVGIRETPNGDANFIIEPNVR